MNDTPGEEPAETVPPIGSNKMWIGLVALIVFFMAAVIVAAIVAAS